MSDLTQMFDFAHVSTRCSLCSLCAMLLAILYHGACGQPDLSMPDLPVPTPLKMNAQSQLTGGCIRIALAPSYVLTPYFVGTAECLAMLPSPEPSIPYGAQTHQNSLVIENGFKASKLNFLSAFLQLLFVLLHFVDTPPPKSLSTHRKSEAHSRRADSSSSSPTVTPSPLTTTAADSKASPLPRRTTSSHTA